MSTLLLERSKARGDREAPLRRRVGSPGPTLDELIAGAWRGLRADQAVSCPVCHEPMVPRLAAGGGRCTGCGSELG